MPSLITSPGFPFVVSEKLSFLRPLAHLRSNRTFVSTSRVHAEPNYRGFREAPGRFADERVFKPTRGESIETVDRVELARSPRMCRYSKKYRTSEDPSVCIGLLRLNGSVLAWQSATRDYSSQRI